MRARTAESESSGLTVRWVRRSGSNSGADFDEKNAGWLLFGHTSLTRGRTKQQWECRAFLPCFSVVSQDRVCKGVCQARRTCRGNPVAARRRGEVAIAIEGDRI